MSSKALSADGHRARLRARFEKTGFVGFAEHEILELLLTLAIPRRDVKPLARQLIARFETVRGVLNAPISELRKQEGMGAVSPVALHIIREAAALYLRQEVETQPILNGINRLIEFWQIRLLHLKHEVFEVAFLDRRYTLIKNGIERLQEGDIDSAVIYPRRIFATALERSAAGIVFAHNHPTGEAYPSQQDRELTHALVEGARLIGITVVDHIIMAADGAFSFRRAGLIE